MTSLLVKKHIHRLLYEKNKMDKTAIKYPVDFMVILSGDVQSRHTKAQDILKKKEVKNIMVTGVNEYLKLDKETRIKSNVNIIKKAYNTFNTRQDIKLIKDEIVRYGFKSVVIITSKYHLKRTRSIVQREIGKFSVRLYTIGSDDHNVSLLALAEELIKYFVYRIFIW